MFDAYAYYDNLLREYIVEGHMQWKRKPDYDSTPYWYYDITQEGEVGGYEGVGLEVEYHENTNLVDYSLVSLNSKGNLYRHRNADDWDRHVGVTYKVQDYAEYNFVEPSTWRNWDYTFDSYHIYTYWTLDGPIGRLGIKHRYGHTWDSTSVTSTSIGWPGGISFTFSSSSNRWDAVSNPAYWVFY